MKCLERWTIEAANGNQGAQCARRAITPAAYFCGDNVSWVLTKCDPPPGVAFPSNRDAAKRKCCSVFSLSPGTSNSRRPSARATSAAILNTGYKYWLLALRTFFGTRKLRNSYLTCALQTHRRALIASTLRAAMTSPEASWCDATGGSRPHAQRSSAITADQHARTVRDDRPSSNSMM